MCSPEDLDTVMSKGLGLRYSFMGPFETMHLNATGNLGILRNLSGIFEWRSKVLEVLLLPGFYQGNFSNEKKVDHFYFDEVFINSKLQ